jgi:hypothetical protein
MLLGVKEHKMRHGQIMMMDHMIGVVPHLTRYAGPYGRRCCAARAV